ARVPSTRIRRSAPSVSAGALRDERIPRRGGDRGARRFGPLAWTRSHRAGRVVRQALALLLATLGPRPVDAELAAGRLTAETFAAHAVGGPDAEAGIGDWFLGNGTLCAAVSDPDHESPLSPRGGVLIDLGHCGRADDQWSVLQPLVNLSQDEVFPIESIAAGRDAQHAWLQTYAVYQGVELVTTYAVDEAAPTVLSISLR